MKKILNVLVLVIVFTLGATSMHVYNKINNKEVVQKVKSSLQSKKMNLLYEIAYLEKNIYKDPIYTDGVVTHLDKLNIKLNKINTEIASIK